MDDELELRNIPSEAILYRWIHKDFIYPEDPTFILPAAFSVDALDKGMSTDWKCEYCEDASSSLQFIAEDKRASYGIAEIEDVGEIRKIVGLSVEHAPEVNRLSHSDIFGLDVKGNNLTYLRMKLHNLFTFSYKSFQDGY